MNYDNHSGILKDSETHSIIYEFKLLYEDKSTYPEVKPIDFTQLTLKELLFSFILKNIHLPNIEYLYAYHCLWSRLPESFKDQYLSETRKKLAEEAERWIAKRNKEISMIVVVIIGIATSVIYYNW